MIKFRTNSGQLAKYNQYQFRELILLLAAMWLGPALNAQSGLTGYRTEVIGSRHGLPSSEILSLFQDAKGFVWIGTNAGLSRYDGYHFENFLEVEANRLGATYSIRQLSDGNIWLATETGIYRFRNNGLVKLPLVPELTGEKFADFEETPSHSLYIAGSNGLYAIDSADREHLARDEPVPLAARKVKEWEKRRPGSAPGIIKLAARTDKQLAIATVGDIYFMNDGELSRLWSKTNPADYITCLQIDQHGSIVWGSALLGMRYWRQGKLMQYDETNTYDFTGVYSILPASRGFWVFSTASIKRFIPGEHALEHIVSIDSLSIKWPTCMLADHEGNFWLGSHEGIYLLKTNAITAYRSSPFSPLEEVYSLAQLDDGRLLAGCNRGKIVEISPDGASSFLPGSPVVPRAEVYALYQDRRGWLWAGTGYQGIARIAGNQIERFTTDDGLVDNSHYHFLQDSKGTLWTIGDNGITRILPDGKGKWQFRPYRFMLTDSADHELFNGIEGPDGRLWLASDIGILIFDGNALKKYDLPGMGHRSINIRCISTDSPNRVWMATMDYGLIEASFNEAKNLELKQVIGEKDGLISNSQLSICFDNRHRIWTGSYNGISCLEEYENGKYRISNFAAEDGLPLEHYQTLYLYHSTDDRIWIGTSRGTASFLPDDLLATRRESQLFFTHIDFPGGDSIINIYQAGHRPGEISAPEITLPYSLNSFTIYCTGLLFHNPLSQRYFYRIASADSSWTEITDGRSISFRRLSPGLYRLQLMVTAGGNRQSTIRELSIRISPPFWRQTWFLTSLALLAIALLAYLFRIREKTVRKQEAQKTEMQKYRASHYRNRLEIEQVVNYFGHSLDKQNTIDDMLWDVCRNCISKLGFEDCVIYLYDESRSHLLQKAAWGPKTTAENAILKPIDIPAGKGITGAVAHTGRAEVVADTRHDDRYIVDDKLRLSEICVPLISRGTVIGVIDSEHSQPGYYTDHHLQMLNTISALLVNRIEKKLAEQESREKEMQVVTLTRDLATSQLTALRAQMNPHFIFNALNSVQQFILRGDVDEANHYLSKFSRLQRMVLNYSDQQFISVEKEIDMLQLYLSLEQLRFGESFEYSLSLSDNIDPNEIQIPPMILQPFVENAIWHGLMAKEGHRRVDIHFNLAHDDQLQVTIRDNGIGRKAAASLHTESDQTGERRSRGINLVNNRLQILSLQFGQPFGSAVSDILNSQGETVGTEVKLTLYIGKGTGDIHRDPEFGSTLGR